MTEGLRVMNKLKIVVKEPFLKPIITEIGNGMKEQRKIVGGWLEFVRFGSLQIVLNEDGKRLNLTPNVDLGEQGIAVGTVFVTKFDADGNDIGLTEEEVQMAMKELQVRAVEV